MDTKGERKTPLQQRERVVCGMSFVVLLTCNRAVAKILVGSSGLIFWPACPVVFSLVWRLCRPFPGVLSICRSSSPLRRSWPCQLRHNSFPCAHRGRSHHARFPVLIVHRTRFSVLIVPLNRFLCTHRASYSFSLSSAGLTQDSQDSHSSTLGLWQQPISSVRLLISLISPLFSSFHRSRHRDSFG